MHPHVRRAAALSDSTECPDFRRGPRHRLAWSIPAAMTFLAVALFTTRVVQVDAHENVIVEKKECQVKYVYLYSFGLLTTWPKASFANDKASFVIGVFGEKPYSELLDRLARTKKIRGRRIVIHRFRKSDDYKKCHILYITRSVKKEERVRLLKQLHRSPVLVVGETEGMEWSGGVMNFYVSTENVRFLLNLDEVDRRGLSVSAQLSRLATVVRDKGQTP